MDRNNDFDNTADRTGDSLRNTGDRVANSARNAADRADDLTTNASGRNDAVGETTGGLAGALTGAALGSLGGPIGTIIGGIAGAVGGWWSGKEISVAASKYSDDDDNFYRSHYEGSTDSSSASTADATSRGSYDSVRPAYQLGHLASQNPDYRGRSFDEVEPDLQRGWTNDLSAQHGDWSRNRDYARNAFSRGSNAGFADRDDRSDRLTLSEEQLNVGKQQVQAGEATLRKTVETEHVSQQVPVMHEEVTIERRPISAGSATNANIGEDEIRIPLTAEEVVVDKRAVATEEVVLKKQAVTENKTVEADLRRERVDESGLRTSGTTGGTTGNTLGRNSESGMSSGAADRATNSGPLDRLADKADDFKDRVDGNPNSRPGPDSTDRNI